MTSNYADPIEVRPNGMGGTIKTLAQVMDEHPQLCLTGIGVRTENPDATSSEQMAELIHLRADLVERERAVQEVVGWLRENVAPTVTPSIDSYAVKHVVERATGEYVANGEIIAAALMMGYPYTGMVVGQNLRFAMNLDDIDVARGLLN